MPILDPFEDAVQFHRPRGFESAFRAHRNNVNQGPIVAGAFVIFDITTEDYDYINECDLINNRFQAAETGIYKVRFQVGIQGATAGRDIAVIIDDGAGTVRTYAWDVYAVLAAGWMTLSCEFEGHLVAGELCRPQFFISGGAAYTVRGEHTYSYFLGHRVR